MFQLIGFSNKQSSSVKVADIICRLQRDVIIKFATVINISALLSMLSQLAIKCQVQVHRLKIYLYTLYIQRKYTKKSNVAALEIVQAGKGN